MGRKSFLDFALMNSNETLIGMSEYRMEARPQISYALVFHSKQGPIFSYPILKIQKVLQQNDF